MLRESRITVVILAVLAVAGYAQAARQMENLGRGVVAVRSSSTQVFISWRLLGLDPVGIGFNVYRSTAGATAVKLNSSVLTGGTNYTDGSADLTKALAYHVKPVIGGVEQAASGSYTLKANTTVQPCVVIPLSSGNTDEIHFVWVGDLDGDGEYEFIVDRLNWVGNPQKLEAYKRDGTLLWSMNLGPNSTDTYNIEPGSSCIDVGHWDGVTVYDLDGDGKAEVMIRTANGVTFGDGTQLVDGNNNNQFISVLSGMTGAERARIQIPTDYIADGPMGCQLGIGYLNGTTPSLVAAMKNRIGSGDFNMMICAWDFDGSSLTQKWKWLRGSQNCSDGHQMRIVDVNGDGKDEVCEIGFVLKSDGTLLYSLGNSGVAHGDRWHIGKFDPSRAGLQGYGIQQDNPSGLREYYYDAGTGAILWTYVGAVGDMARGDCGDIDPRYTGFECWSFDGVWNGPTGTQITAVGVEPYPVLRLWWDGDDLSESYNDGKIEKWNYSASTTSRLVTTWNYETYTRSARGCPMFYGDIFGDWREEIIVTNPDYTKLGIFTTTTSTSRRIYTLPHNPEYRNCMTVKGYMQANQVDFYLGDGMATPPAPDIVMVIPNGDNTPPTPNPMTFATAPYGASVTSVAMVATAASDASGVEYIFTCTAGGGHSSSWQDSTSYTDTGLAPSTSYTYTVKARDKSSSFNMTAASSPASAATLADTTAPTPNPMTFLTAPYAVSSTSVAMVASTATDISGVEYIFTCTSGNGHSSAWQPGTTYTDTGLAPSSTYTYTVMARDKSSAQNTTSPSNGVSVSTAADSTAPTPNPMTWVTSPYAAGPTSIMMVATTASDISGVEYFFHCTVAGGHDSDWQDSSNYTDTNLAPSTSYTYQVKARDKSIGHNETNYSIAASASTEADVMPPTPNPMTWAVEPHATGIDTIAMTATTAADISGVEYYFANLTVTDGSHDSGWQDSPQYTDTGLANNTTYTYAVGAQDKSPLQNATDPTSEASATTPLYDCTGLILSDIDGNCQVDFLDLALIGNTWVGETAGWISLMQFAVDWLTCNKNPSSECWQ